MTTSRPSTKPTSLRPWRKAASCGAYPCAVVAPRSPTIGTDVCWARAITGATATPPIRLRNSRRLIPRDSIYGQTHCLTTIELLIGVSNVRFGSLADICSAKRHVRFTPNSDRESGFPHNVMSALPPKADMCGAKANVCYGPKRTSPH
jgi:hypothetical protein